MFTLWFLNKSNFKIKIYWWKWRFFVLVFSFVKYLQLYSKLRQNFVLKFSPLVAVKFNQKKAEPKDIQLLWHYIPQPLYHGILVIAGILSQQDPSKKLKAMQRNLQLMARSPSHDIDKYIALHGNQTWIFQIKSMRKMTTMDQGYI